LTGVTTIPSAAIQLEPEGGVALTVSLSGSIFREFGGAALEDVRVRGVNLSRWFRKAHRDIQKHMSSRSVGNIRIACELGRETKFSGEFPGRSIDIRVTERCMIGVGAGRLETRDA
jgi:hypothetical protein